MKKVKENKEEYLNSLRKKLLQEKIIRDNLLKVSLQDRDIEWNINYNYSLQQTQNTEKILLQNKQKIRKLHFSRRRYIIKKNNDRFEIFQIKEDNELVFVASSTNEKFSKVMAKQLEDNNNKFNIINFLTDIFKKEK